MILGREILETMHVFISRMALERATDFKVHGVHISDNLSDLYHPGHPLFSLLLLERRCRNLKTVTSRFKNKVTAYLLLLLLLLMCLKMHCKTLFPFISHADKISLSLSLTHCLFPSNLPHREVEASFSTCHWFTWSFFHVLGSIFLHFGSSLPLCIFGSESTFVFKHFANWNHTVTKTYFNKSM